MRLTIPAGALVPQLRLFTYNLQRGLHLARLREWVSSTPALATCDVLAVQEASPLPGRGHVLEELAAALSPRHRWEYRTVMTYPDKEYGNGFLIHPDCELVSLRELPLPRLERLSWIERRKTEGALPDQKAALLGEFRRGPLQFRVANVHLDFAGRWMHRRRQLEAVSAALAPASTVDVVCGDFNTVGPWFWPGTRSGTRKAMADLFAAGFIDATADVLYTNDMFSSIDPADPSAGFLRRGRALGVRFRQKMDHILVRGAVPIPLDLGPTEPEAGFARSDHVPLGVALRIPA